MNYTIQIQTPNKTHYIKDLLEDDVFNFETQLNMFLASDNMAFFTVEVPDGKLLLPFEILMNTEITIY